MGVMSSTAGQICQASLHLQHKAVLYTVDMTLGAKIHKARKAKKLTLQALGDKLGVTRQLVNQWEKNKTDPRKHIEALCVQLEVPYEYFYGLDHNKPAGPSSLDLKTRRLTAEQYKLVENMVDALLGPEEVIDEKIVK